ncbi:MAG: J domain-containing protein [Desulfobacterales bacterium]|nr:J domain-containing protein [Desulfobacterales bacterium]
MLSCHLTLGLEIGASDQEIRKRYLELIKRHTPEKDPEQFRKITAAYEKIKTPRLRIHTKLFGAMDEKDLDAALLDLCRAGKPSRRRAGLRELLDDLK